MSTKDNLLQAHKSMIAVLDHKFQNVPEWKAFRAIDKALLDLIEAPSTAPSNGSGAPHSARIGSKSSYLQLGIEALNAAGEPLTTVKMIEFISARREIPGDLDHVKRNIVSTFSKSGELKSVPWRGGRAWWHVTRPVPKESAGTSANS
jgi:hypothetical protein